MVLCCDLLSTKQNLTRFADWAQAQTGRNQAEDDRRAQLEGGVEWRMNRSWFAWRLQEDANRDKVVLGDRRSTQGVRHPITYRGCCPAAFELYRGRSGFRCCTQKLHEIVPLQPVGGSDWAAIAQRIPSNSTIVLVGDSMVQQQFISLICLAWAERGFRFESLRRTGGRTGGDIRKANATTQAAGPEDRSGMEELGEVWEADVVRDDGQWLAHLVLSNLLVHVRQDGTVWSSPSVRAAMAAGAVSSSLSHANARRTAHEGEGDGAALLSRASYLILGGWQHVLPTPDGLQGLVERLGVAWPALRLILVEAMPSHFPGGHYKGTTYGRYPAAVPYAERHCDQWVDLGVRKLGAPSAADKKDNAAGQHDRDRVSSQDPGPWPVGTKWIRGVSIDWLVAFNDHLAAVVADVTSSHLYPSARAHVHPAQSPYMYAHSAHGAVLHGAVRAAAPGAAGGGGDLGAARHGSRLSLLRVASLYRGRGEAHIDNSEETGTLGHPQLRRDCLQ